ncbi:MAG: acetate kinase [Acidobacteriales bacterium]|nr:acetate kinase [Terriglobales bacterium]
MKILVLNSGSSSQKSALYELEQPLPAVPPEPLWRSEIEWEGGSARMQVHANGASLQQQGTASDRQAAVAQMLETLVAGKTQAIASVADIAAIGHRVVHGGPKLYEPTPLTPEVKATIASAAAFAPLHNRSELEGIEIAARLFGDCPQIAVFDTGFHHDMPMASAVYPGPYAWWEQGIRRYGFHGINHEYCAQRASQLLRREPNGLRLVSCHLGNGCSLAAVAAGKSVDTTMGFTPLEGLMMGSRSGSVDPGILTYLMRQNGLTGDELDDLLNRKSGLLGVSGISSDMREIQAAVKKGEPRAQLAFNIYVHRLRQGIAAMAASMGGMDALIFTAGVGEHSEEVRAAACANLAFLGVNLDAGKNAASAPDSDIASADSPVRVLIIRAQEDWAIAKACYEVLHAE